MHLSRGKRVIFLEALVPSSPVHVQALTSGAHISPPFSSRRRWVAPTDASLSPSSNRRQVSPIQALEVLGSPEVPEAPVSPQAPKEPHTDEPVLPQTDEVDEPVPPQVSRVGPIELSLLPYYTYHTAKHIWDGEVKLVGFILFKLLLLSSYKFLAQIYFSAGS